MPCLPRSLTNWEPSEALPDGVSAGQLVAAIDAYSAALQAAPVEAFGVLICRMLDAGAALGRIDRRGEAEVAEVVRVYRSALGDLPEDLLARGISAAVSAWKYPGLPEPDAIRSVVTDEMSRRVRDRGRAEIALRKIGPERKPGGATGDVSRVISGAVKRLSWPEVRASLAGDDAA